MIFEYFTYLLILNIWTGTAVKAETHQSTMKTGYVSIVDGFFGDWKLRYDAPKGYLACGMALRDEEGQGWGDDSANNAIKLIYCKIDDWQKQQEAYLNHGIWGYWKANVMCPPNNFINGVQAKLEEMQYSGDDSALNGLRIKCSDPTVNSDPIVKSLEYGGWGDWLGWVEYSGRYICGGQVRFEENQGSGDDTALNGVKFNFCKYDNIKSTHFEYYIDRVRRNPSPLVVDTQTFANRLSTEQTYRFKISKTKSVTTTWERMEEMTMGMSTTISGEVPAVAEWEVTVSFEAKIALTNGQSTTTEHSFENEIEVKVPPCTKVSVSYVATEDKVDIPYQATITYDDDSKEYLTGYWKGAGYYNGHAEAKTIESYGNC